MQGGAGLPKELFYEEIRPKGYVSEYKEWPVDPMSSNAYWASNEIVRLLIMLNEGWMDPFRSYFQIEVQVDPGLLVGGVQIDSSAMGLISQMVCSSGGRQVERISEYDTLAAVLTDLGFSQAVSQGRDLQGMGASQWTASESNRFPRGGGTHSYGYNNSDNTSQQISSDNTLSPTRAFIGATVGSNNPRWQTDGQWRMVSGATGSQASMTVPWNSNSNGVNLLPGPNGIVANVRADYLSHLADDKYIQSPLSLNKNGIQVGGSSASNTPYTTDPVPVIQNLFGRPDLANTCAIMGYNNAYSPLTSKGVFQPVLSNSIPQCSMRNGQILPVPLPVRKRTFLVPVLSAIVGVLIPQDQYKLLPLKSLMNFLMEITLSPYAMFSTGYSDRNEFDSLGMTRPIPRAFRITKFQWILNIYNFPSEALKQYLQRSLVKGINLTCTSYMLGSQYQIPNGQLIRNAWQVNSTAESLAEVMVVFLSNDYQRWPYCRKQFRLSNNITSMQLKFNTNYYPPQPITGNAGNPQPVQGDLDNMNYYLLLLKSNNLLFSVNQPLPRINRVNFAINQRCYDPNDLRTFAPQSFQNTFKGSTAYGPDEFNGNTAMGLPFFHENRWIGKAVFVYSFQPFAHSRQYTMGVDSRQARPFQIIFNTAPTGYFKRDQTMLIFLRHNVMVMYTKDGVVVYGQ